MKTFTFILMMLSLYILGCKKNSGPTEGQYPYPVTPGTTWNYSVDVSLYNFQPIQPGATFRETITHGTAQVQVMGQVTLPDSTKVLKLHSNENADDISSGDRYYLIRNDTMYVYAYSYGTSLVLPKHSSVNAYKYSFHDHVFHSLVELRDFFMEGFLLHNTQSADSTIFYETKPPAAFVFPLYLGQSWDFRQKNSPSHIGKKIVSNEIINTTAGSFGTFKIQWLFDWNNDGVWDPYFASVFEYVSNLGLIKRGLYADSLLVTGPSSPDPIGYVDWKEEYILTSMTTR